MLSARLFHHAFSSSLPTICTSSVYSVCRLPVSPLEARNHNVFLLKLSYLHSISSWRSISLNEVIWTRSTPSHFNSFPISLSPIFVSCLCTIMTSAYTFHRIIGVQDAMPYAMGKKEMDDITFSCNPRDSNWTVNHRQFPLRAAYASNATTFNSSQSLTLQRAVSDLHSDPFAHGQLYTTPSRARNHIDIMVLFAPNNEDRGTANILFKRFLL